MCVGLFAIQQTIFEGNDMITEKTFCEFWDSESDNFKDLCNLIEYLKTEITSDIRDNDNEAPYMQITISVNKDCTTWSYQSGDNSYTGSCYGDPYWGVTDIVNGYSTRDIAKYLINDLSQQIEFTN